MTVVKDLFLIFNFNSPKENTQIGNSPNFHTNYKFKKQMLRTKTHSISHSHHRFPRTYIAFRNPHPHRVGVRRSNFRTPKQKIEVDILQENQN